MIGGRTSRTFVCPACGRSSPAPGACPVDASALVESSDVLLGSELGNFRVARVLGRGGMGTVYAGVHLTIGSAVAIKVIAEEYARDAELLERFFREARAVNLVKHEGIVNILDFARLPDGRPYITMELLEGKTLRDLIRAGSLPLGGLVTAMIEVLDALAATHAIQIIHRDLKPDNVFISSGGRTKVLDFGIAKLSSAGPMRTQTGVVLGTPEYMAPEQISGGACDVRTDLYAIGVMLFEGVTGERPFDAASDYELMRAHLASPPPVPSTLRADVPPSLDDVILCALAKQPGDRFSSATAMIEALRYVASTLRIDQWLPLMPRGRLMTPRPPSAPASGPFVFLARSPSPSETTPMRPQSSPGHTADATVRDLPAAGDPLRVSGPKIPGPTQAMPVAPHPARGARSAGAETEPTRHERRPHAAPRRRPRWPWIAGAGVAAIGVVALMIATASSEHRALPAPTTGSTAAPIEVTSGTTNLPADYDPVCFDPIAYLPRAQRIAAMSSANAVLATFVFDVGPSGCADVRQPGGRSQYIFRSSTGTCIVVMIQGTGTKVIRGPGCASMKPLTPQCTVADVLRRAAPGGLAAGTTATLIASQGGWVVTVAGKGTLVTNACDTSAVKAAVATGAVDAHPFDRPGGPEPAAPEPVDAKPVDTKPVDTRPAAREPVAPTPLSPQPADEEETGVLGPYDVVATKERYDPKRFDARAFYPRAVALARSRIPDAQPVRIIMRDFTPDGAIVLPADRLNPTQFIFQSASLTEGRCSVVLTVYPDRVETQIPQFTTKCPRLPTVTRPRCSSEQVRAMAPKGTWLELEAAGWTARGVEIADDCE